MLKPYKYITSIKCFLSETGFVKGLIWDVSNVKGFQVSSGIYFYNFKANDSARWTGFSKTFKKVLIK